MNCVIKKFKNSFNYVSMGSEKIDSLFTREVLVLHLCVCIIRNPYELNRARISCMMCLFIACISPQFILELAEKMRNLFVEKE